MATPLYPIRAVSKLTGISIDTLRAWERRYQAVVPRRDESRRLYTEADVRRLQLLNAAVDKGHAISRLAGLSDGELEELIARPAKIMGADQPSQVTHQGKPAPGLSALRAGIERLDYAEVERELSLLAAVLPPRELVYRVVLPLMRQVGEAWEAGELSIAQEHMASSLLRNLMGALVPLYRRTNAPASLLLATPGGELHEFGILISAMLAAGGGLGIVYLGTNLPADEIIAAAQKTAPQAVVLGLIGTGGAGAAVKDVKMIARRLPAQIELWVGGVKKQEIVNAIKHTRALIIDDFEMLEQHLSRLGARF